MKPEQNQAPASIPNRTVGPRPSINTPTTPRPSTSTPIAPRPTVAPVPNPEKTPAVEPNTMSTNLPKKNNKGMILGMILLAIIAVAGIAFGVWTMLDSNTQKDQLNSQITALKAQNNSLQDQITELQQQIESYDNVYEIYPPEWGEAEAVIENGLFTIKTKDGETYTELDDYTITEIVSCDSGTVEAPLPMTCIVNTPDGEAKIIYNYDEQSIEYVENN